MIEIDMKNVVKARLELKKKEDEYRKRAYFVADSLNIETFQWNINPYISSVIDIRLPKKFLKKARLFENHYTNIMELK